MKEIFEIIEKESKRQEEQIQLIASENFVSENVLKAQGSILTNKYAEGYPGKRYYGGCEFIDEIEEIAKERLQKAFNTDYHANVQPHSGSQANQAVYFAVLNPGDKVLGMSLTDGGHLTHGHKVNASGKLYDFSSYGVDIDTGLIDYENVRKIALEVKPKLIVAGASAYAREIDFEKFADIAKEVGAYLMADVAHIAGLIVAGEHPTPIGHADFITSTTHKTFRGPRGGIVLCKPEYAKMIDMSVFPGLQGGPLEHVIAAKAVAFNEALSNEFKEYIIQVKKNSKVFAEEFMKLGYKVISNGTDNHLCLVDVLNTLGITGAQAQKKLDQHLITVNKNTIPGETQSPMKTSGIRLGTPAMTTRGYKEEDFIKLAHKIDDILRNE